MISLLYSKTNPCGTLAFPHRPVQDVGSPLAVCPCFGRPQHPELSPEPLHSWWGEHTWHLRQQSQISRLPRADLSVLHRLQLLEPPAEPPQGPLAPHPPCGSQGSLEQLRGVGSRGDDQWVCGASLLIFGFVVAFQHFPTARKGRGDVSPGTCSITWGL